MFCKLYTIEVKGPNMCEPCRHHAMRRGYADPFSPITRPCISYLHMIPKGPLFIPMQPKPSGPCQPREPQAGPWEYVPSHLYPDFWNHRPGDPVPFWWGHAWGPWTPHPWPTVPYWWLPRGWMPGPLCGCMPRQAPVPPRCCCGPKPPRQPPPPPPRRR